MYSRYHIGVFSEFDTFSLRIRKLLSFVDAVEDRMADTENPYHAGSNT